MADVKDRRQARLKNILTTWVGAVLLAGVLLLVNYAASFLTFRYDASEGKIYSLSSGTEKILKELEDPLLVQVFFSSPLPHQFKLNEKYIRDLLVEYRRASGGRVRAEFIDPNQSEEKKSIALQAGVAPVKLDIRRRDRREVQESYMGLALVYGDQKEVISFVSDTAGLEYEMTSRIKKLIRPGETRIGLAKMDGTMNFQSQSLAELGAAVNQIFKIEEYGVEDKIPLGVDTLWFLSPSAGLSDEWEEKIRGFLARGGTVGILADGFNVEIPNFQAQVNPHGLNSLFSLWGVNLQSALVVDPLADQIQVQSSRGFIRWVNMVTFPYFPLAMDLNREHPATKGIDGVSFPFVSPIQIREEQPGLLYTPLAKSSDKAWLDLHPKKVAPVDVYETPGEDVPKGPFILGLLIEGKFGKEEGDRPGRVILFGTSKFIRTDFPPRQQNFSLFINLMEWSAQEEALLSIRAKGVAFKPLKPMGEAARALTKYLMIAGLPLTSIFVGLFVWRRGKKRRARLKQIYGEQAA